MRRLPLSLVLGVALFCAAGSGFLAKAALAQEAPPGSRTITVDVPQPIPGPPGPAGPAGPPGPSGDLSCPAGFEPGLLIINSPGGHARVWACLGGP